MIDITLDTAIAFIWAEADMLDRRDYRPWLALWTDQGRYIIPADRDNGVDHAAVLNIVYDDQDMRAARVKRLLSGFSTSATPPARTVRTVSCFVPLGRVADGLALRAAQHLVEYKYGRTRILAADVTYRLVQRGEALRIEEKVVRLINCDDALHGIGYLL